MSGLRVLDSHTGGEPTRLVLEGLAREVYSKTGGSVAQRLEVLRTKYDHIRTSLCNEPRGSEAMVGAALLEPQAPDCVAGVIFFNNAGYLGMCGHGTIGLLVSLCHLGRLKPGRVNIETPVGVISAELHADGQSVTLENVPSFRYAKNIPVDVPGYGRMHGDIAWGGNWFFLVNDHGLEITRTNIPALMKCAQAIQAELRAKNVRGPEHLLGGEVDHIELFGPPSDPRTAESCSFVLCPGAQYDRSPCGTGTSAKLACLVADGKLPPGKIWRQESVIGSIFDSSYQPGADNQIIPTITGRAFVLAETLVHFDPQDAFTHGIR